MFILILSSLLTLGHAGELVKMNPGESDEDFVKRITKEVVSENFGETTEKQIFRSKDITAAGEALIAFTESAQEDVNVHVFIAKGEGQFEHLAPATVCEPAGGAASIASVFYFDVDKDKKKEIAALCKWHCNSSWDCCLPLEAHFFKVGDKVTEVDRKKFENGLYRKVRPNPKSKIECQESRFSNAAELKQLLK